MSLIKRFERNTAGRDFAVGDIHGHFTLLQQALDTAGFNPAVDRLFSVGDLIDRGPECEDVIKWLNKPWFHPVRGNHDDYVCRYDTCEIGNWMINGGSWFVGLPSLEQENYAVMFRDIPIGIEIDTSAGLIGLIHADCVFDSWDELKHELDRPVNNQRRKLVMNTCMWSRTRVEQSDERPVHGLRALVVGHNPLRRPLVLGNVFHIDTMGWRPQDGGYFTLLNLETLEAMPPMAAKLEWEATA
ncbi:metallophosphoesterase [Pseudomonas aeruginosa]|uniref:metallophosphoesterase n=1 Tax=Pseudomonas aeruginosa TaxID=287 RepID=UPI003EDC96B6|nr:metallophosphoesterase [Pseudomonas aeruginosa]HCF6002577.1 metallophosphoesterase [Pseudomonas aeruginosa]